MRVLFFLFTILLIISTDIFSQNLPKLGVIRWDSWHEQVDVTRTLSPNEYHNRVPFFGKEIALNAVETRGASQVVMDQEIAYAKDAGISFFAFYWYEKWTEAIDTSGNYFYGRELFKTSTSANKEYVKAAYILSKGGTIPQEDWNDSKSSKLQQIGEDIGREDYYKVLISGSLRPLVFYHGADSDDLISFSQRKNLVQAYKTKYPDGAEPYIVNLAETSGEYAKMSLINERGQAICQYVTTGGAITTHSYNEIIKSDIESWYRYKNAGCQVVPVVTVGYDRRPRITNPVHWENKNYDGWVAMATNNELKKHLQEAIDFVKNNPNNCEANTILCYAWNEHDEGGFICPTIVPDGNFKPHTYKIDRSKLDVVKSLFNLKN